MENLFRWFPRMKRSYQKCKEHDKQVLRVCISPSCSKSRLICADQRCFGGHEGHDFRQFEQYQQLLNPISKHIKLRESLQSRLKEYKQRLVGVLSSLFEQMRNSIFTIINSKYCESAFLEIERLYRCDKDFIPLMYGSKKSLFEHYPEQLYKKIQKMIEEKESLMTKFMKKMEVAIDIKSLTSEKIEMLSFNLREGKIKSLLPFASCELKLRFKASENEFLSKKLFAVNIRGPIVLYVQSYKNMHFGGYSSVMFPKYQEYYTGDQKDVETYIFSLDHNQLLPIKEQYKKYAIKGGVNFGFGQGDLLISDQCNKGNISWAEIGRSYKQPSNVKGPLNQWLGGASYFRVIEYQVYSVQRIMRVK